MNRFKLDDKDARVHQNYLIDVMQDPASARNAENKISWFSFYSLDKHDSNSN